MKKLSFVLLASALVCSAGYAQKPKGKIPDAKPLSLKMERVEPVDGETFSYAFGVANADGLRQYLQMQEGVDSAHMRYALEAMCENMSDEQAAILKARAAGAKLAKMNTEQVLPMMNVQAAGSKTANYADMKAFNRGLADAINGKASMTSDSAANLVQRQMDYQSDTYRVKNEQWLADNAKQKDVKTLPGGVQYRILTKGNGPVPTDTSTVEVNYEGKLIDGTVFDSSYERGQSITFPVNGVIKGWQDALKAMPEGSIWELFIPQAKGYGDKGTRSIPPYSTLIFKVELLNANAPKAASPRRR